MIKLFGSDYALNESLAYSLQFSRLRTSKQKEASKKLLSSEYKDISDFIKKYRDAIKDEIFASQEYSIKLIQIPKIANTNKNDLAIEFVNWNSISEDDRDKFDRISAIVKDKVIKVEGTNVGKLKPGAVLQEVNKNIQEPINHSNHKHILSIFNVRPYKDFNDDFDPFETNTNYCHYDEVHNDYLYQESWVQFLTHIFSNNLITKEDAKKAFNNKESLNIEKYEI